MDQLGGLSGNDRIMFQMTMDGLRGELEPLLQDMDTYGTKHEEGKMEDEM